jgi:hypothetical protein
VYLARETVDSEVDSAGSGSVIKQNVVTRSQLWCEVSERENSETVIELVWRLFPGFYELFAAWVIAKLARKLSGFDIHITLSFQLNGGKITRGGSHLWRFPKIGSSASLHASWSAAMNDDATVLQVKRWNHGESLLPESQ